MLFGSNFKSNTFLILKGWIAMDELGMATYLNVWHLTNIYASWLPKKVSKKKKDRSISGKSCMIVKPRATSFHLYYLPLRKRLLQNASKFYLKRWQLFLLENTGKTCYKTWRLLCYKMRRCYYKTRQVWQNMSIIRKRGITNVSYYNLLN